VLVEGWVLWSNQLSREGTLELPQSRLVKLRLRFDRLHTLAASWPTSLAFNRSNARRIISTFPLDIADPVSPLGQASDRKVSDRSRTGDLLDHNQGSEVRRVRGLWEVGRQSTEPAAIGRQPKTPVPGRQNAISGRHDKCRCEVEGIERSQILSGRELGGAVDQALVHLHDVEERPLLAEPAGGTSCGARGPGQRDQRLRVADPADMPCPRSIHRLQQLLAARLGDIALDERAGVEVEVQRSASRSSRTWREALRLAFEGAGLRRGLGSRESVSFPSASSCRSSGSSPLAG
jgi:hypothetical protein